MKCFNCGDDADMEIFMMINNQMKKIGMCTDCYREQTQSMFESMQDENGNINPEEIQKKMFDFFKNNKEEFNKLMSEAIDADFDIDEMDLDNFDISQMNFDNAGFDLSKIDASEIFSNFNKQRNMNKNTNDDIGFPFSGQKQYPKDNHIYDTKTSSNDRQIKILQSTVDKKRTELLEQLQNEDYMSAANSRDEIREINKKIMIIKRLSKEGEI